MLQMEDRHLKSLGLVIVLLGVFLPTYLATNKLISDVLFGLIFIAFLAAGFLIYKIDEIVEFETKIIRLKTLTKEVFAKAEEVKKLSKELDKDKGELREATKIFIESFYLSIGTRNQFPPPEKVLKKILKNLDVLAVFAIKNEKERDKWITDMQDLLKESK